MKPRFSPSCDRSCVKMADRFASRRYSLKNKLGDRMIKQLLNSVIAKYRDLPVSRRSIICLSLQLRANNWSVRHWQITIFCSTPSNKYTLFDGLAYNTCGYFASCVVFPNPAGARKNTSNEQSVRSYYMLNHRIRGLLFHYKKKLSGNWLLFFCKSIQRHPDSVSENDVNN